MNPVRRIALGMLAATGLVVGLAGCQVHPEVMRERGQFHFDREEYDQALGWYEQLVQARPTDWDGQYHLGVIYLRQDNPNAARRHLELAYALVRDDPRKAPAVVDALAETMFRQKQYSQLFGLLDEAIDQYGTVRDYVRKGGYLYQYGDHDAALVAYRQAARMAKNGDLTAYETLGDFYASLGENQRAIVEYRRAYTLDPQYQPVREKLLKLGVVPGPTIRLPAGQLPQP